MMNTLSNFCWQLSLPCVRKRRLLLAVLILCGIATVFLQSQLWHGFRYGGYKSEEVETDAKEAPSRKLIFLQVLFRHGHHAPFGLYPGDPNPEEYWVEGLSSLTKIGRIQHYNIGKYMRQMYEGFLGHSVQEVDCMTSISSRSHYGAFAFFAGFYPAPPEKRLEANMPAQPIPCSLVSIRDDKYLQSTRNCPAAELDKSTMSKTKEAREFMKAYEGLYSYWSDFSGLDIENYGAAGFLYKTLLSEKTENLTIPAWAAHSWQSLVANSNKCYYFHFKTRLVHRLRAGPLIGKMVEEMRNKIQNPNSKLKVYVYSGHGSNVAAVLNALQVFNYCFPPYASTIVVELHQEKGGGHTIRLLLLNGTEPENHVEPPHVLKLPGCSEFCPLEELERQTADLFPVDWEKECHEENPNRVEELLRE